MNKKDDLINHILKRTREVDGKRKLTCAEAFKLSKELGAGTAEIGRICNQQNIRICKCQLGLFP
ncbi:MAG: hypothetical protein ACYS67_02290 [Planctomycetota bacterium]|jgi:hypothetical protein